MKDYPSDISSFGGGLAVSNGFLSNNSDVVVNVVHALLEALAFCLGGRNKEKVMEARTALSIADEESAASSLGELRRKPYPSLAPLEKMQAVISIHNPRVLKVTIATIVEDRFVRKFDEDGELDASDARRGAEPPGQPCSCIASGRTRFSILPFLNLSISEMQETSYWPTHRWNVMSEQRKSNWQHPNSYYWEREETEHSATDECDTRGHPHPFRTLRTKTVQIMADPGRDVILEALHFLVEIGNPRHARLNGSHGYHAAEAFSESIG